MATFYPTPGNDLHTGTEDGDRIDGGQGDDTLYGMGGNDTIDGGSGANFIDGGDGDDRIWGGGGSGNNTIHGGSGNDEINTDHGDDRIFGEDGNDTIRANNGDDYVDGGAGDDYIDGGEGNDSIAGGLGHDSIDAGSGNDTVWGDEFGSDANPGGNDTIHGGEGHDVLHGGGGDDRLYGDTGNDWLLGGDGNDYLSGADGADTLEGGAGNDTLLGGNGADWLDGGSGDDSLDGGYDNDTIFGGAGNDYLFGNDGNDFLDGGTGNDTLDGGWGVDTMVGGDGFDLFIARSGGTILDFNTTTGGNIRDGNESNNDLVDLSAYYNTANLALFNARTGANHATPLDWLRADQDDDGKLNSFTVANGLKSNFIFTILKDGAPVPGKDLTPDNTRVICFSADALITTTTGPRPAGKLEVGDMVLTRDNGPQPIRWIAKRLLTKAELLAAPSLRPIRIHKGALGAGIPSTDLVVSPEHRMLARSAIAQRMFGAYEVLAAARHLLPLEGVEVAQDLDEVTYVHFMFEAHEIVWANDAETESLFIGPEAMKTVGPSALEEILTIFPDLRDLTLPMPARPLVDAQMAQKLSFRHQQSGRAFVI